MKQILTGILLLALLTGCGAQAETPPRESGPERLKEEDAAAGLSMELEHPVYAPSLTRYTYFIRNNTEEAVEFGEPYSIQRRESCRWADFSQPGAFTSIGYIPRPGGTMALTCGLDACEGALEPGEYRLVKTVEDTVLYAEFSLGESLYTAETPYGFGTLEALPETYGAGTASELDVVFDGSGMKNQAAVESFLFKAGLGAPCQLRTVQDYGEGAVLVTDVLYENDHFTLLLKCGTSAGGISYQVFDPGTKGLTTARGEPEIRIGEGLVRTLPPASEWVENGPGR